MCREKSGSQFNIAASEITLENNMPYENDYVISFSDLTEEEKDNAIDITDAVLDNVNEKKTVNDV